MQPHQPRDLTGPLRGTSSWWRGLESQPDNADLDDRKENSRKGKKRPREHGPPIRQELVDRVRREIAAGTYDTPEKWEAALDRLLERLDE